MSKPVHTEEEVWLRAYTAAITGAALHPDSVDTQALAKEYANQCVLDYCGIWL